MSFCCRNCIRIRHRHHQVGLGWVIWLLYLTLAVLVNVFFLCLSDWGRPVVSRVFKRGPRTSRLPPSFFLCYLMTTQVIVISLDYKLRVGTKTLEWIFASADWVGLAWLAGLLLNAQVYVILYCCCCFLFLIWYRYKPHQQLMAKWLGCKERRKKIKEFLIRKLYKNEE